VNKCAECVPFGLRVCGLLKVWNHLSSSSGFFHYYSPVICLLTCWRTVSKCFVVNNKFSSSFSQRGALQ
jgi:hypothetical protein